MKVLVINAGSSSLKYQLIDMETEKAIAKGGCERIGLEGSFCKHKANGKDKTIEAQMPTHKEAIQVVLDALVDKEYGAISSMDEIDAVGHRIVHSGEEFNDSVLLTDETMATIESLSELAPLHQPANIIGVKACKAIMPNVPMVGVFDTAFHSSMPEKAYIYGIPYEAYKDYKIRRYGFHGTSHRFVSNEAAKYLGRENDENFKVVTLHLGNGSSISAVKGGKSIDTSMSFTPLGGVPMGTRSGDMDPAIVEFLANKYNMTLAETLNYLNKKSGVSGLSGVSSDFRDLRSAAAEGNHRAQLALDVFTYSCRKYLGAYAAALGGVDCVVFTAGIGEHDGGVRKSIVTDMEYMGICLDEAKNDNLTDGICDITADGGKVKILVIPTNEELVIARDTERLAK
ncbi:MAG: acetate kinase [Clostridiales bacterium]|nr:acetate kinase [Clostridiales bacterium]